MFSQGQKIFNGLIVSTLVMVIIIPHLIVEFLTEFIHVLFEVADITFEAIESSLDSLIEIVFGTDLHKTQLIVFYIIVAVLLFGVYRVARKLPAVYLRWQDKLLMDWILYKMQWVYFWRNTPFIKQVQWIIIALTSFSLLIFFAF